MRKLFTFLVAVLLTASVFAQTPEKMSYQAVIRNSSDALVTNTQVGMQISILQGSASGTVVYTETQTPTTNVNGLVSMEIGSGAGFSTIDWANDIYFIKTETDPTGGTNYTIIGTSQLLSVPYALHAKTAESVSGGIIETDPIFTNWDKDYADLTNTPTTITTAQADAIVANTAKNSYPETDATKLAGIEDGAQVNVQADWDATTGDALILNKPDIPEAADGSETKVTAGTNVSVTGAGTADSPYEISATGATGLPTGTAPGQMQYWDGTKWVTVAAGNEGQVLTFTGGVPTWTTTAGFRDVQNPVTGAIWMDRNLGSTRVATSRDDENSYGDLYQWGRGADWHQIRTSGTTSALSGSATPGHSDFIMSQSDPVDWLITQNNNLWQGLDGINNPCPDGYRLPTRAEWEAEKATWSVVGASGGINSHLKLPAAGARSVSGDLINKGNSGDYWSSTVSGTKSFYLTFWGESTTGVITEYRAVGMSVRCIKD